MKKRAIRTTPLLTSDQAIDKKQLYNQLFDLFELAAQDLGKYQMRLKLANFDSLYKDFSDTAIANMHKEYDWCFLTLDLENEFKNITPEIIDVSKDKFWSKEFHKYLLTTTSHDVGCYIGRVVRLLVIDKYKKDHFGKNYVLGFIILNSPLVYSGNRNQYFFNDFKPSKSELTKLLNNYFVNAVIIVPTQSFGRFLLGGKLLALIALSKKVADIWDSAYGGKSHTLVFETTSLYASLKPNAISQYDGLDKYLKKIGITDSSRVFLQLPKGISQEMNKIVSVFHREWYAHNIETETTPNAPKQKIYKKFIQDEFLPYFKKHDPEKYIVIRNRLKNKAWSAHSRKNTYAFLPYTKEQTISVFLEKIKIENLLKTPQRVDNSLSTIVEFWRNKATKRLEKKKEEIKQALAKDSWLEYYTRNEMCHGPKFKIIR